MRKRWIRFRVERHGVPIAEYGLSGKSALNVGITHSNSFREIKACVAAGLDYEKWRYGGYERDFMDEVLAWHDLTGMIEAHVKDAEAVETAKQAKKGKKGKK